MSLLISYVLYCATNLTSRFNLWLSRMVMIMDLHRLRRGRFLLLLWLGQEDVYRLLLLLLALLLMFLLLFLTFVATVVIDFVGFATLGTVFEVLNAIKMTISVVILNFITFAFAALDVVNPTVSVFKLLSFLRLVVRSVFALFKRPVTVPVALMMSRSIAHGRHK